MNKWLLICILASLYWFVMFFVPKFWDVEKSPHNPDVPSLIKVASVLELIFGSMLLSIFGLNIIFRVYWPENPIGIMYLFFLFLLGIASVFGSVIIKRSDAFSKMYLIGLNLTRLIVPVIGVIVSIVSILLLFGFKSSRDFYDLKIKSSNI